MDRAGRLALATIRAIERAAFLDPVATGLTPVVDWLSRPTMLGHLLKGTWLGHSVHPLLTDFTEGPWMAASFLDLFGPPGSSRASRRLLGFGLVMAVPTYLAGLADWTEAEDEAERRVGVVHLATVSSAIALYVGSYLARVSGRQRRATALGLAGGLIALVDGYVGGHMGHAYGIAVGETVPKQRGRS
jgi:uncharacterized membrane protein